MVHRYIPSQPPNHQQATFTSEPTTLSGCLLDESFSHTNIRLVDICVKHRFDEYFLHTNIRLLLYTFTQKYLQVVDIYIQPVRAT